jgi:hypothetical protein
MKKKRQLMELLDWTERMADGTRPSSRLLPGRSRGEELAFREGQTQMAAAIAERLRKRLKA